MSRKWWRGAGPYWVWLAGVIVFGIVADLLGL
jgi:hypothetical protein